jgi:putative ABC transport system permease protein
MGTIIQDLRYGLRMLRKQPAFSVVAVTTVALAIGANTTIFSFANIFLLRPLPIANADEMAWIWWTNPHQSVDRGSLSVPDYLDLRDVQSTCESLAAFMAGSHILTGRGEAARLTAMRVTANLLATWRTPAHLGRLFVEGDAVSGAPGTVILSHRYWVSTFNAAPSVIGQSMVLDGRPHTIVGVLTADIEIGNLTTIDVWTPLILDRSSARDVRILRVSGRRKPGVTLAQVDAEVKTVARRLEADHPATNAGWSARVVPTRIAITGENTWAILGLLGMVVGLILFIACANLANLMLVRGSSRGREIAVRAALGAGRARLVRQLMCESTIIGALGGASGLALAYAGLRVMRATSADPFFQWVSIDVRVLLFAVMMSLLTPLVFSALPALRAARPDLNDALREGLRGSGGPRGHRARAMLVVSQLTLALALMIVAGVAIRGMVSMMRAPLGFEAHDLLTIGVELPSWKYPSGTDVNQYWKRLMPAVRSVPGVSAAAAASKLPVIDAGSKVSLQIEGREAPRIEDRPWAAWLPVTDDYFRTVGIPLRAGRPFNEADSNDAPAVAVISQEMARRHWRTESDAIGARVEILSGVRAAPAVTIVGVVSDVKRSDLRGTDPALYVPVAQHAERALTILVRGRAVTAVAAALRQTLHTIDADVPAERLRTMEEAFENDLSSTQVLIGIFTAFGVLALALAAAGLYGVMSYLVSQRVKEFGIRMALGAAPAEIRALVRRQTALLVVTGTVLGLVAGAALSSLTGALLYDTSPLDPAAFAVGVTILVLVAMAAGAFPIRRATRVDPISALRTE